MKRRRLITSLMLMVSVLIAAQCGAAVSSPNEAPVSTESAAVINNEENNTSREETVAEAVSDVDENTADSEAKSATENSEAEVPDESTVHGTDPACDDPFADVGVNNLRFTPNVWTADQIARYAGEEIVDSSSGLITNFCLHNIDYREVLSGGPPPDGIPPIDNPTFEPLADGDAWLSDNHPVIALVVGDEARAYPLGILTRHEIANDTIAGMPVAVTFCPLCNAGIVFNREVEGEVLRFGVSGNLRNSDLIMWDNKTLSWWQQFTGEAIVGEMTGTRLEIIPAQMVAWKDFKAAHPEGVVLSSEGRNVDVNPYTGYDSSTQPFLFRDTSGQPAAPDPRLPALERVLGYASNETAVAYPLSAIAEIGVIADTIDGQEVVIFYEPGAASALDGSVISESREVGAAGMFIPLVAGEMLTFSYDNGRITDNETGSEWDIFGTAVDGELEGSQLEPVVSHTHFWFAWAAFQPDTRVYER
ncbi:MAG: DUF3179 domain-containing protein [Anaerolineae bacterium]|nr:DUF3179 domain-containing protein [Anaerolineae bacterium]